jgi:hypothetical protein
MPGQIEKGMRIHNFFGTRRKENVEARHTEEKDRVRNKSNSGISNCLMKFLE